MKGQHLMNMKKRFAIILSLLLALALAAPGYADMTSEEKDKTYQDTITELEAYLYGTGDTPLQSIEESFRSLGRYSQSEPLMQYTRVLMKLEMDDYGYQLITLLEVLGNNERFGEYLSDKMSDSPIMPVEYLARYTAGRRMEYEGDIEGALEAYKKTTGFFDSSDRYTRIKEQIDEKTYVQAQSMLNTGDFAGAYYTFDRAGGYMDSSGMKAGIASVLGYTPANETDNPGSVSGLQVNGRYEDQITLTWNSAAHASKYEVSFRKSGTQAWTVSETTGNTSATVAGLAMDTVYDFRVTAIIGSIWTESAELTGVRTAKPMPTPLVLQQASGLKAQKTEPTSIMLTWNSVPNVQRYRVMVKENNSSSWSEGANTTGTTAQITGLSAGTEYQFKVVAENGGAQSESRAITVKTNAATPAPKTVNVGEYITFGHYEQDNNTGNGKEPIEWLVLEVRGNQALLISRYGLDVQPYNTIRGDLSWETSSLRKWLNGEFLNNAFSTKEQKAIVRITVDNSASQGHWNTSGGNNTEDRIFLLSYAEANKYLGVTWENRDNMRSRMSPTAYAQVAGARTSISNKTAEGVGAWWWWLRSPGYFQHYAAYVCDDGSLHDYFVNTGSGCVRPALWVNLESDIF